MDGGDKQVLDEVPVIVKALARERSEGTVRHVNRSSARSAISYYVRQNSARFKFFDPSHAEAARGCKFNVISGDVGARGVVLSDGYSRVVENAHGLFVELSRTDLAPIIQRMSLAPQTAMCVSHGWELYKFSAGDAGGSGAACDRIDVYHFPSRGTVAQEVEEEEGIDESGAPPARSDGWVTGAPIEGCDTPLGDMSAAGLPKFVLSRNFGVAGGTPGKSPHRPGVASTGCAVTGQLSVTDFFAKCPKLQVGAHTAGGASSAVIKKKKKKLTRARYPSEFSRGMYYIPIEQVHIETRNLVQDSLEPKQ